MRADGPGGTFPRDRCLFDPPGGTGRRHGWDWTGPRPSPVLASRCAERDNPLSSSATNH